jgi:hypothetical protein
VAAEVDLGLGREPADAELPLPADDERRLGRLFSAAICCITFADGQACMGQTAAGLPENTFEVNASIWKIGILSFMGHPFSQRPRRARNRPKGRMIGRHGG